MKRTACWAAVAAVTMWLTVSDARPASLAGSRQGHHGPGRHPAGFKHLDRPHPPVRAGDGGLLASTRFVLSTSLCPLATCSSGMIDILDLLHVTPRLWDAAWLFHPGEDGAAERFVRERVLRHELRVSQYPWQRAGPVAPYGDAIRQDRDGLVIPSTVTAAESTPTANRPGRSGKVDRVLRQVERRRQDAVPLHLADVLPVGLEAGRARSGARASSVGLAALRWPPASRR